MHIARGLSLSVFEVPDVDERIQIVLEARDLMSGEVRQITGHLDGMDKVQGRLKASTVAVGTAIGNLAADALRMATQAIGDMAREAVEFDRAMLNVNSIAKVNDQTFNRMKDSVIELSTQLPMSASNLAEGLYNIQSSGFAGEQGLKVLDAAAKAASAGLTNTNVSAAGLTAVLNSYGLTAEDAAGISDIMFETVNRGVITFEELSSEIGKTTALASPLGVSFEEVSAAIAVMTRNGISAENATTQLNAIMATLLKPSGEAVELAQQLGIGWNSAALESQGLVGVLTDMIAATEGNEEAMATLLGDTRAIRGAMVLAGRGTEEFARELGYMENAAGATDDVLSYQKQGLAYNLELLKNQATAVALGIAEHLIPVLVRLTDIANDESMQDIPVLDQVEDFLNDVATSGLRARDTITGINDDIDRLAKDLGVSYMDARRQVRAAMDAMGIDQEEAVARIEAGWTDVDRSAAQAAARMHQHMGDFSAATRASALEVESDAERMSAAMQASVEEMKAAFGDHELVASVEQIPEGIAVTLENGQVIVGTGSERMMSGVTAAIQRAEASAVIEAFGIPGAISNAFIEGSSSFNKALETLQGMLDGSLDYMIEAGERKTAEAFIARVRAMKNASPALIDQANALEQEIQNSLIRTTILQETAGFEGVAGQARGMALAEWLIEQESQGLVDLQDQKWRDAVAIAAEAGADTPAEFAAAMNAAAHKIETAAAQAAARAAAKMRLDATAWGEHLVGSFATGMENRAWQVSEVALAIAGRASRPLAFSAPPDIGPLSSIREWGPHLVEEFAGGIAKSAGLAGDATLIVAQEAARAFAGVPGDRMAGDVALAPVAIGGVPLRGAASATGGRAFQPSVTVHVHGPYEGDLERTIRRGVHEGLRDIAVEWEFE